MALGDNQQGDRAVLRVTRDRADASSDAEWPTDVGAGTQSPERGHQVLAAARAAADSAAVREVGSTGVRALEPLVLVTRGGRTAFHPRPSPERTREVVEAAEGGDIEAGAEWVVEHDPNSETLPRPSDGPLAVGTRRVLGECGWTNPEDGDADATALARDDPERALRRLRELGVLGRGRGDARQDSPVAESLQTVRETAGDPVVVVNANESDDRNETDRTLLGGDPAAVVDGALAAAEVVGADPSDVVVYTNEGDALARERARSAVQSLTGEATGGAPQVVAGPDEYIAGEHTMALEALEGNDRLEARLRPPGPDRHGLYGRPTVVHTPRTFAQVRAALLVPESFDAAPAHPGPRLFPLPGLWGPPPPVELPTGGTLADVRGAVSTDGRFKMACVGGQFGGFTRTLEHGASALALSNAGLGTEGVVELFDDDRCAVAVAGSRARFASEANCGRCFPCREGSKQLLDLLRGVYDGRYEDDMLRELTRSMRDSSICHFGQSAARSVGTALDRFETEFRAHADGRCPSGACEEARP